MSRIDELIGDLCPDGVMFKPLGDLGKWYGGGTPSKHEESFWRDGTIPWLSPKDMGKAVIDATQDTITEAAVAGSATKLVPANSIAVVVRSSILDQRLPAALVTVPVTLNQDMKALVARPDVLPSYVAHLLRSFGPDLLRVTRKTGGSVASIEVPKFMRFRVPVPPLEVQREIVRVLDAFSSLEAELEAELEARRRQYEHYRDSLLTFADDEVRWTSLDELADFTYGYTASAAPVGDYRFIRITDITPGGKLRPDDAKYVDADPEAAKYLVKQGDLLMARTGATYGKTMLVEENSDAVFASFLIRISLDRSLIHPEYYWHFAQSGAYWAQANALVSAGGQPQFNANVLKTVRVAVPSLSAQQRIIEILDSFDALVNDLSVGLPAELAARRKQFEHYRDKLLTFKELPA